MYTLLKFTPPPPPPPPYPEVVIGFEETVYPAEEGDEVEVCVVLVSGELERDVVVRVSSADGTATGECSARFG